MSAGSSGEPAARAAPAPEPRLSLRPGVPDVSGFPRSAWVAALRRALTDAPDAVLRAGDPRGRPELRTALARYLGRARGVLADPERIVVCAGFTEGLALLCRALRGTGALAMEDPCFAAHRAIVHAAGLRVAPLAVDEHGARPDVPPDVAAVHLTPAHQFPHWHRSDRLPAGESPPGRFAQRREPSGRAFAGLVVGYAAPPEHAFTAALDALSLALSPS